MTHLEGSWYELNMVLYSDTKRPFFHLGQNKYHNCFGRALFVGEIQSKYLKAEEAPAH